MTYNSILIVEDDLDLATSLARSFERRQYETCCAKSVGEISEILKKFHPRQAVIDLKLGQSSGLEAIKILHDFDKTIKIVMLTGFASISTTIEAIKLGASYYLAKPANVDEIIAAFDGKAFESEMKNNKKTSLKNLEWEYINQTLSSVNFNISKAARILGLHRRTLARKLNKKHL